MKVRLKTKEELVTMREGGRRHAAILAELASRVAPGISTLTLEEEALRLIREYGDRPAHLGYTPRGASRPFPAALCLSINDEIVHGIPNENIRVLKDGDIISIDLSLEHEGLITDSAVTVGCGVLSDESKKLLEVTREALVRGIEKAISGNTTGDIGYAISKVVRSTDFSLAEGLAGHGVGFEIHEEPLVPNFGEEGSGTRLVLGMVLAIEPMVNIGSGEIKESRDGYTILTLDGSRSAHFEHTVAITEKGNIILTSND